MAKTMGRHTAVESCKKSWGARIVNTGRRSEKRPRWPELKHLLPGCRAKVRLHDRTYVRKLRVSPGSAARSRERSDEMLENRKLTDEELVRLVVELVGE